MVLLISILLAFFVPYPWNVLVVFAGVCLEVLEVIWGRRLAKRWRPKTGPETMIGEHAEVGVSCRPTGQVRINGELWEATCVAGADVGEETVVQAIEGLTLIVEPAPAAEVHPIGTM